MTNLKEEIIEILEDYSTDTESKTSITNYADQIIQKFLEILPKEKKSANELGVDGNYYSMPLRTDQEGFNQCLAEIKEKLKSKANH